ncbi:hypothetical protein Lal_00003035 [Lupinus albus]|nr:hypothetical protein Lal_00003035 [Lupinus albus]
MITCWTMETVAGCVDGHQLRMHMIYTAREFLSYEEFLYFSVLGLSDFVAVICVFGKIINQAMEAVVFVGMICVFGLENYAGKMITCWVVETVGGGKMIACWAMGNSGRGILMNINLVENQHLMPDLSQQYFQGCYMASYHSILIRQPCTTRVCVPDGTPLFQEDSRHVKLLYWFSHIVEFCRFTIEFICLCLVAEIPSNLSYSVLSDVGVFSSASRDPLIFPQSRENLAVFGIICYDISSGFGYSGVYPHFLAGAIRVRGQVSYLILLIFMEEWVAWKKLLYKAAKQGAPSCFTFDQSKRRLSLVSQDYWFNTSHSINPASQYGDFNLVFTLAVVVYKFILWFFFMISLGDSERNQMIACWTVEVVAFVRSVPTYTDFVTIVEVIGRLHFRSGYGFPAFSKLTESWALPWEFRLGFDVHSARSILRTPGMESIFVSGSNYFEERRKASFSLAFDGRDGTVK